MLKLDAYDLDYAVAYTLLSILLMKLIIMLLMHLLLMQFFLAYAVAYLVAYRVAYLIDYLIAYTAAYLVVSQSLNAMDATFNVVSHSSKNSETQSNCENTHTGLFVVNAESMCDLTSRSM